MKDNRNQILIELAGHDHLADLRTHSANEIYDILKNCMITDASSSVEYFGGKLLAPSFTPGSYTEPGFTTFTYDEESKSLVDL